MAIQKYPYKVTKINWYDYISRGETNIVFSFLIECADKAFSFESSTLMLYFIEKMTGEMYVRDTFWVTDDQVTGLNGLCSFVLPKNIKPGVYNVQLKTKTIYDEHNINIGTIPTNKDELQITVLDTQAFNLEKPIPVIGRELEQKEVEWTDMKTEEGGSDENV